MVETQGHQHHVADHLAQDRIGEGQAQARPHPAPDRLATRALAAQSLLEPPRRHRGQAKQARRQQHQTGGPQHLDQARGQQRSEQRAQAAAGGHEAEQASSLLHAEQVGQRRPESRDHQQVEHADPDEDRRGHRRTMLRRNAHPECEQGHHAQGQQQVHDRDHAVSADPGHHRTVRGDHRQHHHERAGEQPLHVVHAGLDPHLVAQGPDHVQAREQQHELDEGPGQPRAFSGPGIDQPGQHRARSAGPRWITRRCALLVHGVSTPIRRSWLHSRNPGQEHGVEGQLWPPCCIGEDFFTGCWERASWVGSDPWADRAARDGKARHRLHRRSMRRALRPKPMGPSTPGRRRC